MRIRCFALPDYQRLPTNFRQRRYILFVAFLVALQLRLPIIGVRLRNVRALAAVRVPEAPMHEYRFPATREHDVRRTRQRPIVEPEPESRTMQH